MFNPSRLTLARQRRKMTRKGLAEIVGVTPLTITRLEKQENEPLPENIDAIAGALGFPKDFFFGDDVDELTKDSASFRSLSSMTAKQRDSALASGTFAYMFSDWVTEKFKLPKADLIDLSAEPNPESAANALRQYWGLGEQPISDMIKLLESKGVRVFSLVEDTKNVDAFSCWRNETPYIFLNTFKTPERCRFDAAHELGHLILHKHGGPHRENAEKEANGFASPFLMPRADILAKIPYVSSIGQLVIAKKRWKVSVMALAYRLHKMNILSDWQHRSLCIQYRVNEPDSIPRETSVVWKMVFSKLWKEKVTKSHIAKSLHLPQEEIENIVYGLTTPINQNASFKESDSSKPKLRVIKAS